MFELLHAGVLTAFLEGNRDGINVRVAALCVLTGAISQREAADRLRVSRQAISASIKNMRSKMAR